MVARIYDSILIKRRVVLIFLVAVLTVFFVYKCTQYVLLDDPNRWPPKNDPNVQLNDFMQTNFGGANLVTIQVTVKEGDIFNPVTLKKIDDITFKLNLLKGIIPFNLYSLSALRVRYLNSTEDMLENTPLMEDVPTDQPGIDRVKWGVEHNPNVAGVLVSPDYKSTLIRADFRTSQIEGSNIKLPVTDPIEIYKEVRKIIDPENDMNHTVRCVGTPIIIGWVNSEGLPYVYSAFAVFLVGILIVLIFSLRRKRIILLGLMLGLLAVVWGFGINGLLFGNVLRSSSAFIAPFIIMAAATCHGVQFFRRFLFEEHCAGGEAIDALRRTVHALFSPMVIALITDCTAFVVLSFVPFDNVSVMGKITFLGLISAVVCMFLFIVPVVSLVPPRALLDADGGICGKEKKAGTAERIINHWVYLLIYPSKFRWVVMGCLTLLTVVSIFVITKIKTGQDNSYAIHNYLTRSYKTNSIYLMEQDFKKRFKGVYTLSVLIETKKEKGLAEPKVLRKIDEFAKFMKGIEDVAGTSSFADAIKLMNKFYTAREDAYVLPETRDLNVYYYCEMLNAEPGSTEGIVDQDMRFTPMYIYVETTKPESVEGIFTAAVNYARDHFNDDEMIAKVGGGDVGIARAFNENIYYWLIWSLVSSAVVTYVVCAFLIGSTVAGIYLLIPLFVGMIIWLAAVYLCGIEINSNTTGAMAIASGVGVDAEVYFLYRFREEFAQTRNFREALLHGFTKIRMALVFSTGALVIGLFMLIPIPLYIGYVAFGMGLVILLCFVTSFLISPFLWSIFKPSFLFAKEDRGRVECVSNPAEISSVTCAPVGGCEGIPTDKRNSGE